MKKTNKQSDRILSRKLAKTLTRDQLEAIGGGGSGTTTCSPCCDDSDAEQA